MYQTIYDLLISTIFDGVAITGWIELVVTLISTCCCLFAVAVPFIVLFKIICIITGR